MCDTCPAHIPGPGEVAGGLLGLAVGAAMTKPGRRVLFWGVCVPALPFAIWGELHWWTLAVVAVLAAVSAAGLAIGRVMHRFVVQARPEPTHQMREQLAARGLRTIPAPVQLARPALPRGLSITRKRQALPAPARALPAAVVVGKVVPAGERIPR